MDRLRRDSFEKFMQASVTTLDSTLIVHHAYYYAYYAYAHIITRRVVVNKNMSYSRVCILASIYACIKYSSAVCSIRHVLRSMHTS